MLTHPSLREINSLLNRIHDSAIPRVSASITGLNNHDSTTAGARDFGLDVGWTVRGPTTENTIGVSFAAASPADQKNAGLRGSHLRTGGNRD